SPKGCLLARESLSTSGTRSNFDCALLTLIIEQIYQAGDVFADTGDAGVQQFVVVAAEIAHGLGARLLESQQNGIRFGIDAFPFYAYEGSFCTKTDPKPGGARARIHLRDGQTQSECSIRRSLLRHLSRYAQRVTSFLKLRQDDSVDSLQGGNRMGIGVLISRR